MVFRTRSARVSDFLASSIHRAYSCRWLKGSASYAACAAGSAASAADNSGGSTAMTDHAFTVQGQAAPVNPSGVGKDQGPRIGARGDDPVLAERRGHVLVIQPVADPVELGWEPHLAAGGRVAAGDVLERTGTVRNIGEIDEALDDVVVLGQVPVPALGLHRARADRAVHPDIDVLYLQGHPAVGLGDAPDLGMQGQRQQRVVPG